MLASPAEGGRRPSTPSRVGGGKPRLFSWDTAKMLLAGGVAGAVARTATAPLDRVKLLLQVQAMAGSGVHAQAYTGLGQALAKVWREEGVTAYWKGNGANIVRIFPYSAAQLVANDQYKRLLADSTGHLSVTARLIAGACAGMTATALTHPIDTVRLRLALPSHPYSGMVHCVTTMWRTEGPASLYKGLGPTLIGIAPYAALNFSSYDLLKGWAYAGGAPQHPATNLLLGAVAGTVAATVCYPLDTIRRRQQMPGRNYAGMGDAVVTMLRTEGVGSFFKGWSANTVKVVPQNAIRFVAYEALKTMFGIAKSSTDT